MLTVTRTFPDIEYLIVRAGCHLVCWILAPFEAHDGLITTNTRDRCVLDGTRLDAQSLISQIFDYALSDIALCRPLSGVARAASQHLQALHFAGSRILCLAEISQTTETEKLLRMSKLLLDSACTYFEQNCKRGRRNTPYETGLRIPEALGQIS